MASRSRKPQKRGKVQKLRFAVDTVRFNFHPDFTSEFFSSLFRGLSLNSPNKMGINFFGLELDFYYGFAKGNECLYFHYLGDPIMCLLKYGDQGIINTVSYSLTFYGGYFYVEELKQLLPAVVERYGDSMTVSRVDLCMDVACSVNRLWRCHKTRAQKKSRIQKGHRIQTFYLGSKTNNSYNFIRVYDKKLDAQKKGKFHLFPAYFLMAEVSRIEIQINYDTIKNHSITCEDVVEAVNMPTSCRLYDFFARMCLSPSVTDFPIVDSDPVYMVISHYKHEQDMFILDQLAYARTMLGYAKRLKNHGFDVVSYLQEKLQAV